LVTRTRNGNQGKGVGDYRRRGLAQEGEHRHGGQSRNVLECAGSAAPPGWPDQNSSAEAKTNA